MPKANGKEIYCASLVLLTGGVYLAAQADTLFAIGSTTVKGDVIQLSKNEVFSHLRTIVTIILCFTGGILLLRQKKTGWVICVSILALLLSIAMGIFLSNVRTLNAAAFGLLFLLALFFIALVFLLLKQSRQRFNVVPRNYLPVAILFVILTVVYFFLQ